MERRVSWVRSWSSVRRSGSSMSSSRIATTVAPACSSACTPALPIVRPAFVHWSRVKAMCGASRERRRAVRNERLVVERHPVRGLELDAVPEGFELLALEHGLARPYRPALIRVLDLESARELAQDRRDLVGVVRELERDLQRA